MRRPGGMSKYTEIYVDRGFTNSSLITHQYHAWLGVCAPAGNKYRVVPATAETSGIALFGHQDTEETLPWRSHVAQHLPVDTCGSTPRSLQSQRWFNKPRPRLNTKLRPSF